MKFFQMIKNLLQAFTNKANDTIEKTQTVESRLKQAARSVSDEIRRLEQGRLTNVSEISRLQRLGEDNTKEADRVEATLKAAVKAGQAASKPLALIVIQRRRVVEAAKAKVVALEEAQVGINKGISDLGYKFEEINGNLELVRVQRETAALGIGNIDDVTFDVGMVEVNVDDILRNIRINHGEDASTSTPSSFEVDEYLKSLSQ